MDTTLRTLVKAIGWQLLGCALMALIGWFFTGSVAEGGAIAVTTAVLSFISYFLYERFWSRMRWGRIDVGSPADLVSKNPRAFPGSAGFQPAAGRRPAVVHAGKMPALPGKAASRRTTFMLRGGRSGHGRLWRPRDRGRPALDGEGKMPSIPATSRDGNRRSHKWDVHPRSDRGDASEFRGDSRQ